MVSTLASRSNDLTELVGNANATTQAIGDENVSLSQALAALPNTLQQGSQTFANLHGTLDNLDTLVNVSKPATKRLAPFLAELRPLIHDADPTIRDLRLLIRRNGANNDLIDLLGKQPKLTNLAKADFPRTIQALQKGQPVIDYIRPYAPDFTGWLTRFAESASPYDANGHYARVQPVFNAFQYSTNSSGSFLTAIPTSQRLAGLQTKKGQRCPGMATQAPPDGSAPFLDLGQVTPACNPSGRCPAHETAHRHSAGPDRRAGATRVRHRRGRQRRGQQLPGARDLRLRSLAVPGEDVKIAGAKVGKIQSLDVTPDNKAAVVLNITERRLHALPRRRALHDPPAVADRREVRRLHPGHRQRAGAAARSRTARRPASTCSR